MKNMTVERNVRMGGIAMKGTTKVMMQGELTQTTWHGGRQGDLDGGTWHGGRQGDLDGGTWHGGKNGEIKPIFEAVLSEGNTRNLERQMDFDADSVDFADG